MRTQRASYKAWHARGGAYSSIDKYGSLTMLIQQILEYASFQRCEREVTRIVVLFHISTGGGH
jgi:hypothetical protein